MGILNAKRKGLILLQLKCPGFVDSPWKALPFGKSRWAWARRRGRRENWGWNVK